MFGLYAILGFLTKSHMLRIFLYIYIITYDNYWTFLGRVACQDIIISGGENISSLEVESIMMKHEKIAEVAVVARRTT